MWYKYLAILTWLALAYYVCRVASIKLAQWWRREGGKLNPFAETLLGKLFGAKAITASYGESVVWLKRQVVACYTLVLLSGAIIVGDIGHFMFSALADELVKSGEIDPTTGRTFAPLTAAEHRQLWLGFALYGSVIAAVLCFIQTAVTKVALWYFSYKDVNPFALRELDGWLREKRRFGQA